MRKFLLVLPVIALAILSLSLSRPEVIAEAQADQAYIEPARIDPAITNPVEPAPVEPQPQITPVSDTKVCEGGTCKNCPADCKSNGCRGCNRSNSRGYGCKTCTPQSSGQSSGHSSGGWWKKGEPGRNLVKLCVPRLRR